MTQNESLLSLTQTLKADLEQLQYQRNDVKNQLQLREQELEHTKKSHGATVQGYIQDMRQTLKERNELQKRFDISEEQRQGLHDGHLEYQRKLGEMQKEKWQAENANATHVRNLKQAESDTAAVTNDLRWMAGKYRVVRDIVKHHKNLATKRRRTRSAFSFSDRWITAQGETVETAAKKCEVVSETFDNNKLDECFNYMDKFLDTDWLENQLLTG